jgi:hypothetical protein
VILANNFSGVLHNSIVDYGSTQPSYQGGQLFTNTTVQGAQVIGNILSKGDSYHLKVPFGQGPNWFLYQNQFIDTNSNAVLPFTDAANLPAHITY